MMFVATLFVVCAAILIDLCACCSCSAGSSFCGRNAKTLFVKITVEDQVDSFAFDLSTLTLLPAKCPIDDMFHGGCFDGGRDCEWRPVNATPADPSPTPTLGTGSCIMLTPRSGRSDAGASLYRCASGYGNRYVVGPPDNDTFSPNWIPLPGTSCCDETLTYYIVADEQWAVTADYRSITFTNFSSWPPQLTTLTYPDDTLFGPCVCPEICDKPRAKRSASIVAQQRHHDKRCSCQDPCDNGGISSHQQSAWIALFVVVALMQ